MVNLTFNDETQVSILPFLKTTEKMISEITSQLSNSPKEAKIYAMSDLGLSINPVRMMGGFFTGICITWDCDIPFVPIDSTINACGVCAYKLKDRITAKEFKSKIENTFRYDKTYDWNYNKGNHFCTLCYCDGKQNLEEGYYILVHASASEYKKGNLEEGLYPEKGNWYYPAIKTYTDLKSNRYLRYLDGKFAQKFWHIAHFLETFNAKRNRYFIEKTFDGFLDREILNIQHYGMPSEHSICIGCHWKDNMYPLLTAPHEDIYLIRPLSSKKNRFTHDKMNFTLTPHGLGTKTPYRNSSIEINKNCLKIGKNSFKSDQILDIDVDVKIRGTTKGDKKISETVHDILTLYPGEIQGKMKQIASLTKRGFTLYKEEK